jgi:hypothetical protein
MPHADGAQAVEQREGHYVGKFECETCGCTVTKAVKLDRFLVQPLASAPPLLERITDG